MTALPSEAASHPAELRVGLISDTHGLLRPEAKAFLHGCGCILHAGDLGSAACLASLEAIAPLRAVVGNVDRGPWAHTLPQALQETLEGVTFHLAHREADLPASDTSAGWHCFLYGHSHKPELRKVGDCVYINPGSIGPQRFRLPVTLADVYLADRRATFRIYELDLSEARWRILDEIELLK